MPEILRHHPDPSEQTPTEKFAGIIYTAGAGKEYSPQTEPLSDERIAELIAAVGNHPVKAAMLAAMEPTVAYTTRPLHRLVNGMQGEFNGWPGMNVITPINYCKASLEPAGLVAREQVSESGIVGYVKTPYGEREGEAIAGHLLAFSEIIGRKGQTLMDYWGSAHTPVKRAQDDESKTAGDERVGTKRAPYFRLAIFRKLLEADLPIRAVDLEAAIAAEDVSADKQRISSHLKALSDNGVITYESFNYGEPFVTYTFKEEIPDHPPSNYQDHKALTREVYRAARSFPESFTIEEICAKVKALHEAGNSTVYDDKTLSYMVSSMLKHIEGEGYLESEGFHHGEFSQISLSDDQRFSLRYLTGIVDDMQTEGEAYESFIKRGKAKAQAIVNDPERVGNIIKVYADKSAKKDIHNKELTIAQIRGLIDASPKGVTSNQIYAALRESFGTKITKKTVTGYLAEMREKGEAAVLNEGRLKIYGPQAKDIGEVSAEETLMTLDDYRAELLGHVRLYRSLPDTRSEVAQVIIGRIRDIRSNPEYQRLLQERDAQNEPGKTRRRRRKEPEVGDSSRESIGASESSHNEGVTIYSADRKKTK